MGKTKPTKEKIILLVEDDEAITKAIARSFENAGLKISIAYNGVDGLSKAEELKPDLILLDIIMPKMDGITMLRALRATTWGKKIPVIILTNLSSPVQEVAASDLLVTEYLIKTDWKLQDVINKVKKMLEV